MNKAEIRIHTTNIIKKCAFSMCIDLLDVTTDNQFYDTFEDLAEKCNSEKIKHNGYALVEGVIWKLTYDKLCPQIQIDSTKKALDFIRSTSIPKKKWYLKKLY
jgi:hypothetical protein